jgi:uncharacterized SAM-binding protein YcdF (DUF218 family)
MVYLKANCKTKSGARLVLWLTIVYHSDDILGAKMLWKPKEARILKNFIDQLVVCILGGGHQFSNPFGNMHARTSCQL